MNYLYFSEKQLSKSAIKNKKKREAARKKREEEGEEEKEWVRGQEVPEAKVKSAGADFELTGDPEKDRKIRNLKKVHYYM